LPSAIKTQRGTLRAHRVQPNEPAALPLRGAKPPAWLSPRARDAWVRLVRILAPRGGGTRVLGGQDLELLGVFADQVGLYQEAAEVLASKDGLSFVVTDGDGTPKGLHPWPEIKVKQAAAAEIRRLAEHFGLSPASRARVSAVASAAEDAGDEFDRFLAGGLRRVK
jgi:P27 family predicted phage terminase small subunit